MDKKKSLDILKKAREASEKKKFTQSFDLIFSLRDIDLKNSNNHVDFFTVLHYSRGKKIKTCALVGPELKDEAEKNCDMVLMADDFEKQTKKDIKKIAGQIDFFIAQANIMPKVAQIFGPILGPKGKMPNPKAGCVVPPKASLKPLIDNLQKTIRASAKTQPVIQVPIGREDMKDEELADNLWTAYDQIIHHLPNGQHNIKDAYVKTTMGKPVKVD